MTSAICTARRAAKSPYLRFLLAGGVLASIAAAPANAAGTQAGTTISNTATATFELPGGGDNTVNSNTVDLLVDELLDVSVVWANPSDVSVTPGATNRVLTFTVTNIGNGTESFALSTVGGGGDQFDPTVTSIVIDTNGNGQYDPTLDDVYNPGVDDPVLDADEAVTVFVLSTIPAGATNAQRGRIDLLAAANTGSGTPGTSFAGQGQGGGAAVVGTTGADGSDDGYYVVTNATVTLTKSATVQDPFGGTTQVPGSIITYSLVANVTGSGSLANLRINDPIPAGSVYEPGSITLEGTGLVLTSLTDIADADAGRFTGTAVSVSLGTVPAGESRTVTFSVKIDDN